MMARSLCLAAGALLMMGCSSAASTNGHTEAEPASPQTLEDARALWQEQGVEDYSVTVQMTCYCPPDVVQPLQMQVRDEKVVSADGSQQPLENLNEDDLRRMTIESLFRFIEDALDREAHVLEVSYDAHYGFPVRIKYDGHEMIADDERQYRLTDFKPGGTR